MAKKDKINPLIPSVYSFGYSFSEANQNFQESKCRKDDKRKQKMMDVQENKRRNR